MNPDQASQRPPGRPSQGPFQGAVAFLQALVAVEPDGLRAWLAVHRLDVDAVAWLHAQGLAPYAFHRLREVGLVESIAPPARDELRQAYYRSSADAAIHDSELQQVLGALACSEHRPGAVQRSRPGAHGLRQLGVPADGRPRSLGDR